MDIQEGLIKVRELMDRHGLSDWTLGLDRALRRFGVCSHRDRTISLSRHLIELNAWPEVEDTALHEIAHALAGPRAGHGRAWREIARRIGCKARRCFDPRLVRLPQARYKGECPSCRKSVLAYRRSRSACGACCRTYARGRFDARFLLSWTSAELLREETLAQPAGVS